jgi:phosphoribosylaminoimidazole-succinocarboxamide synthase
MVTVECIARGYLAGSGLKEYEPSPGHLRGAAAAGRQE